MLGQQGKGEMQTSLHRMLSDKLPENMTFKPRCEAQAVQIYGVEGVSKKTTTAKALRWYFPGMCKKQYGVRCSWTPGERRKRGRSGSGGGNRSCRPL